MSATSLRSATVDVLLFKNELRDWRKPDGSAVSSSSEEGRATVHLLQEPEPSFRYRIYAVRLQDQVPLVNQIIYENFHYKVATPVFHQWKSEEKQVFGLSFLHPEDALNFSTCVKHAIESLKPPDQQYQQINASNGVYQEPQTYYQHTNNRDVDQESIGSGHSNYRQQKSSYSSLQSTGTLNQQQRRCSQGSSGSSGTPSSTNIYATAQTPNTNGHPPVSNGQLRQQTNEPPRVKSGAPPPPPPPPPPQFINGTVATNNNNNGCAAPISQNAPPAPPPPPLSSTSLADQLKGATLRKASLSAKKSSSDTPQTPQPKSSVAPPDFLSELTAKFKSNGKSSTGDNISTSSSSGVSTASSNVATSSDTTDSGATIMASKKPGETAPKPWAKQTGNLSGITTNGSLDSPKGSRKITNSNSVENSSVTVADMEKFKQDILCEVNKTKQEVSEMRQEIAKLLKTQQEMFEAIRAEFKR